MKICTIPVLVAIWAGLEDTHLVNPCHVAGSRDGPFACHNRAWVGPALKSGAGHPAQRLIMFFLNHETNMSNENLIIYIYNVAS